MFKIKTQLMERELMIKNIYQNVNISRKACFVLMLLDYWFLPGSWNSSLHQTFSWFRSLAISSFMLVIACDISVFVFPSLTMSLQWISEPTWRKRQELSARSEQDEGFWIWFRRGNLWTIEFKKRQDTRSIHAKAMWPRGLLERWCASIKLSSCFN